MTHQDRILWNKLARVLSLLLLLAGCVAPPLPPAVQPGGPVPPVQPLLAPQLYAELGVDDLAQQTWGEGTFRIVEDLGATEAFTRSLIAWDSDGLTVYGFMDVPFGDGPFPVVVVTHGYVEPEVYNTLTYTTRYADALARAGFLTIHPNLRGYPPSDDGPNTLRVGFAADVLNLIALIQKQGGQLGPLELADSAQIGIWGHSMGGGISQRVLAVAGSMDANAGRTDDPTVDAAVLYGSMSGDEMLNHERILNVFSGGTRGNWEEGDEPSESELRRISPVYFLERYNAPVSIHHGELDDQVPLEWSQELCRLLQEMGKTVECFTYAGQPHTFVGEGDTLFIERIVEFYDRALRP